MVPPSARPAGATPSDEDTAGRVQAGRRSDETRSTPKPHSDLLALARRSASYGNPSVLRANAGPGPLADAGARGLECRGRPQRAVQRHQSYFLTPTLARQTEAEQALVNGDPGPRLAMTSTNDPETVFGAKVPVRADGTRSPDPPLARRAHDSSQNRSPRRARAA